MAQPQRVGDLEIDQNPRLERAVWVFERVGWTLMLLVVLAAILGLFGPGLFGEVNVKSDHGDLEAVYRRFERNSATTVLRIRAGREVVRDGAIQFWVEQKLIDAYQIERITPQPAGEYAEADRLIYRFSVQPSVEPVTITFHLKSIATGSRRGRIGVVGGSAVEVKQFIYP